MSRRRSAASIPRSWARRNVSRNQNATILSPTLSSAALLYNLYQAQLNVSWSPDIWGQNKRQVEALQAAADAQRFQLDATYVALTSNLAVAVIQQASLREQIAANQAMIGQERNILDIQRRQQALGQIAGADVATQEVVVAQTEQALPPLQKQLAQQDDLVAALTGHMPMDQGDDGVVLSALTLPGDLPLSLPSGWWSSAPTSAPRRKICTWPAPRSASRWPTSFPTSRSAPMPARWRRPSAKFYHRVLASGALAPAPLAPSLTPARWPTAPRLPATPTNRSPPSIAAPCSAPFRMSRMP